MSILSKYADRLVLDEIVFEEDKVLYVYGLKQGLLIVANMLTIVSIGYLFGLVWQSIVFMAAYFPLRSFAGGYHVRTPLRCYWLSILLVVVEFGAIRYFYWTETLMFMMLLLSGSIIFFYSPTEDSNKPLDTVEVVVYKKRARLAMVFEAQTGFESKVSVSLANDCPVILHARTEYLDYYNGNNYSHYISLDYINLYSTSEVYD